jgi:hypothetical protein
MLAVEANGVVALRMMKLMRGGKRAQREAQLMVSEKIDAVMEATASLLAGASGDEIVHRYRRKVAANAKRLGRLNSGRSRKRVLKRTRRDGSSVASDHVAAGIGRRARNSEPYCAAPVLRAREEAEYGSAFRPTR